MTHQEFLARALGSLDLPEVVLPVLQRAITGDYAADVRASAMKSIALVVARAAERGDPVEDPQLVASLIQASADDNPLLRQVAAFTLGLLPSPEALEHLAVMLSDADQKTRLNAAIALARHGRTDGFDVFAQVLQDSTARLDTSTLKSMEDSQRVAELNRYRVEQPMMLKNSLEALTNLSPKLTPEQRTEAAQLAAPIARKYEHPELRKKAADLIDVLTSPDQKNTNAKAA